jgi:hypothetical protein
MTEILFGPWRKSSYSAGEGNCVEIAWRKSSHSGNESNCVEIANTGAVRDSKNPAGATLRADLAGLITTVKTERLDR